MAAITPTSTKTTISGHQVHVTGIFAAITNTDTWATGLSVVDSVTITPGVSGQTFGATMSGGTVTFAASGDLGASSKVTAHGV